METDIFESSQPWLSFLEKAHDSLLLLAKEISFDKHDSAHRCMMMLHGSMIELAGSCTVLFQKRIVATVPGTLRQMLENMANAKCLASDPAFLRQMQRKNAKTQLEILRAAKKGGNDFLEDLNLYPGVDEMITFYENWFPELKDEKCRVGSPEELFKKAGMLKEYVAIYGYSWSSDLHSGLSALNKRHINREESDFSIVFYQIPDDFGLLIFEASRLLIDSALLTHEFFHGATFKKVQELLQAEFEILMKTNEPLFK